MNIPYLSTFATGIANGYLRTEGGLPVSYKYTIMSVSAGILIVNTLGAQSIPLSRPTVLMQGLFLGIPFLVGSVFCTGNVLGKTVRYVEDHRL